MKLIHLILISFIFLARGFGEYIPSITTLDAKVNESSGLLMLENQLITHNDSDEEPELYLIDEHIGKVNRTVRITNVKNHDWEDITADEHFIYIGDFGNNLGSRKNLKVYKISIDEFNNAKNDSLEAAIINFNYSDQIEFNPARFNSDFDAEALISYENHLYIFTKNWETKNTDIYKLSKDPGNYSIEKVDRIETNGLITGAEYDKSNDRILLTGNGVPTPFVIEIKDFEDDNFSSGIITKHSLEPKLGHSIQIEGITKKSDGVFYLSSEQSVTGAPSLFKFEI
ncbi:hypothetical protein [Mesonia sp.]|uniref:hypothetical protein n=1 Tax=Mesonia sp. TaxID=1960830 RepID=UPI0017749A28|nr:hypothetical protein [Mesonia sp.]HIB37532.1 hypothetical protein [Mesonia sp.]HIO27786.1 hypothetical protein [Flavobacteriaceae bacterium]